MANALLRSGDVKDFQALGQDGKAVYLVATQIRETFRVKLGKQYSNHLAIPKRNDLGNIVDWYIPFEPFDASNEYNIVPWSSASDEEKESALSQLEIFEEKVIELGKQMNRNQSLSGDQLLFSRLIYNPVKSHNDDRKNLIATRFPDAEFVYIVNGIPVITFWGFVRNNDASIDNLPLSCLAFTKHIPPVEAVVAPVAKVVETIPWWKRWWLWLLALFLLFALLFLLRGCFTQPDLSNLLVASDDDLENVELDTDEFRYTDWRSDRGGDVAIINNGNSIYKGIDAANGTLHTDSSNLAVSAPMNPPILDDETPVINSDTQTSDITPPTLPDNNNVAPDSDSNVDDNNDSPQAIKPPELSDDESFVTPDNKLALPPDLINQGSTKFLNGSWSVAGGIQDKATGKPLRLQYDFNNGDGTVTVSRANGVKCVGNVGTNIQGSSLSIGNAAQATCTDNMKYQLPEIKCSQGSNGAANCQGVYGNGTKFPITMKKNK